MSKTPHPHGEELRELPLGLPLRQHLDMFIDKLAETIALMDANESHPERSLALKAVFLDMTSLAEFTDREARFALDDDNVAIKANGVGNGDVRMSMHKGDDLLGSVVLERETAAWLASEILGHTQ